MDDEMNPLLQDLVEASAAVARAEFAQLRAMMRFRDAENIRIAELDSPMLRLVERGSIALEIARETHRSEGQVVTLLAMADRVHDHAPQVWAAFEAGAIDQARVREISLAIDRLEREASRERLDAQGVEYAVSHTVAELRAWLRRFVARVESDLALERAKAELKKRHVSITHVDDGMAYLNLYAPSHLLAGVTTRLRRQAKALRAAGDQRTLEQIKADLLVEWGLFNPTREGARPSDLAIDVAVLLEEPALSGEVDGLAESADGAWEVPVSWVLEAAASGDSFWHRLLTDPFSGNTLAHEYAGYMPPDLLRRAIIFRDGVCVTPGCLTPAADCDLDHVVPWPEGRTSAENLRPRSRRHHALKGHGILRARDGTGIERRLPPWPGAGAA